MQPIEIAATVLGIANITLIIRRSIWNFPVALAMVTLYAIIFRDAKLYSDMGLQVFFFAVNLYGWISWRKSQADAGDIVVERLGFAACTQWTAGSVVAILIWGAVMDNLTDASLPYWDAAVAMLSVAAQILMIRRKIENWHWWIVVNAISIPLYITKALYFTAGLYVLFLLLAMLGLVEWRRAEAKPA